MLIVLYQLKVAFKHHNPNPNAQLILPLQSNPSPLYPVLHVQVKLPSVLLQAAFLSQGVDRHSLISVKCYKSGVSMIHNILSHKLKNSSSHYFEQ